MARIAFVSISQTNPVIPLNSAHPSAAYGKKAHRKSAFSRGYTGTNVSNDGVRLTRNAAQLVSERVSSRQWRVALDAKMFAKLRGISAQKAGARAEFDARERQSYNYTKANGAILNAPTTWSQYFRDSLQNFHLDLRVWRGHAHVLSREAKRW